VTVLLTACLLSACDTDPKVVTLRRLHQQLAAASGARICPVQAATRRNRLLTRQGIAQRREWTDGVPPRDAAWRQIPCRSAAATNATANATTAKPTASITRVRERSLRQDAPA